MHPCGNGYIPKVSIKGAAIQTEALPSSDEGDEAKGRRGEKHDGAGGQAWERGIKMPSFYGYMLWSGAILLPLFALLPILPLL